MEKIAQTESNGRFEAIINRPRHPQMPWYVLRSPPGFAVEWIELNEEKLAGELTLHLAKEVPITGRVVNTEGRHGWGFGVNRDHLCRRPDETPLEKWLKGLPDDLRRTKKHMDIPIAGITGEATTDKNGEFTLHGAGEDCIAVLSLSGAKAGIAEAMPYVVTRPGFDSKPYNDAFKGKKMLKCVR